MMALNQVHTHITPEGCISRVNNGQKKIDWASIRNNASVAVRGFAPALAQARAVMVHNAAHPYLIKKGGGSS